MAHFNLLNNDYDITERLDLAAGEFELKVPPEYSYADLLMEAKESILHLRIEMLKGLKELQLEKRRNIKR